MAPQRRPYCSQFLYKPAYKGKHVGAQGPKTAFKRKIKKPPPMFPNYSFSVFLPFSNYSTPFPPWVTGVTLIKKKRSLTNHFLNTFSNKFHAKIQLFLIFQIVTQLFFSISQKDFWPSVLLYFSSSVLSSPPKHGGVF